MKQFLFAVIISTTALNHGWWAVGGPIEGTEVGLPWTPPDVSTPVVVSTAPAPALDYLLLKSSTTANCYKYYVSPNGSWLKEWSKCQ